MKPIKIIVLLLVLSSCSSNYLCETITDVPMYSSKSDQTTEEQIIPKGAKVYTRGKSATLRKAKYGNDVGWIMASGLKNEVLFPHKVKYTRKTTNGKSSKEDSTISKYSNSGSATESTGNNGGSVHVKGYYRKNGTYVRPHTRSSPSSSSAKSSYRKR